MPSRNYSKTIIEQAEIDICNLEHMVQKLQNAGQYFPVYEKANLPHNLVQGEAFCTTDGKFCIYYQGALYCMPAERFLDLRTINLDLKPATTHDDFYGNVQYSSTMDYTGNYDEYYAGPTSPWNPNIGTMIYEPITDLWYNMAMLSVGMYFSNEEGFHGVDNDFTVNSLGAFASYFTLGLYSAPVAIQLSAGPHNKLTGTFYAAGPGSLYLHPLDYWQEGWTMPEQLLANPRTQTWEPFSISGDPWLYRIWPIYVEPYPTQPPIINSENPFVPISVLPTFTMHVTAVE